MSYLPIRKTVPLMRSVISAVAKRTTAMVLTAGSETVPGTAKRGLLAMENAKRTVTVTVIVTATVVIRATMTTSATIRTRSIATGTVYISRKVLPVPTWISQTQYLYAPLLCSPLTTIVVLRKSPILSLTPTLYIISAIVLLQLVVTRSVILRFVKVVVCLSISAMLSIMPLILCVIYIASVLPFFLHVASFSST